MSEQRKFLVIVRADDDSLHERWLDGGDRNWDLVVSYAGDAPDRFRRGGGPRIDAKGLRWPAIRALLASGDVDWRRYDYVWLPQGDLVTNAADISRLFEICLGLDLWLAHPALTWESPTIHRITLHNAQFGLRFTNFVESAAPLFRTSFLDTVLPSLELNDSGGGLDYLWPHLVDDAGRRCAVIDSVPMQRLRPLYDEAGFARVPVRDELRDAAELLASFGIKEIQEINLGALVRTGERYSLFDGTADAFVGRLMRGMIGVENAATAIGEVLLKHDRARRLGPARALTVGSPPVGAERVPDAAAVHPPVEPTALVGMPRVAEPPVVVPPTPERFDDADQATVAQLGHAVRDTIVGLPGR